MATVKENLIAARALIDTPEKWGKGPDRDCFCAVDALTDVAYETDFDDADHHLLGRFLPVDYAPDPSDWNCPVAQFNDDPATTHADIMALFDRAIAAQDAP